MKLKKTEEKKQQQKRKKSDLINQKNILIIFDCNFFFFLKWCLFFDSCFDYFPCSFVGMSFHNADYFF